MRSAGSRRRSGEEQAPNFLGETMAGSSTMGVWIWAAFQLFSAHDALRTDRADLMRWPWPWSEPGWSRFSAAEDGRRWYGWCPGHRARAVASLRAGAMRRADGPGAELRT